MPAHLFHSARVDHSTAVRADISKQNDSVCPRHWYVDAEITCTDCNEPFVFSASEQKFWYEDLHFRVDSFPKQCPPCRKTRRDDRTQHIDREPAP